MGSSAMAIWGAGMRMKLPALAQALLLRRRKRHPKRALTEARIRMLLQAIENIKDDALLRLGHNSHSS